jgi:hypothetical protein
MSKEPTVPDDLYIALETALSKLRSALRDKKSYVEMDIMKDYYTEALAWLKAYTKNFQEDYDYLDKTLKKMKEGC